MKPALVLLSCLLGALAYPQQQSLQEPQHQQVPLKATQPPVPIVSLDNTVNHDGSYRYSYEGGDGTKAEQEGQLRTIGEDAGEVSSGSYSYVGDDGKTYSVKYVADETGYHAEGEHLPSRRPYQRPSCAASSTWRRPRPEGRVPPAPAPGPASVPATMITPPRNKVIAV